MTVRVLVVEDSLTVRKRLVEVLSAADGVEVVGEAADGRGAVEQCRRLRPDVVTMDLVLPDRSGIDAIGDIMAHQPTPILVVSSSTNRGDLFRTCDALAAGALDVLEKPAPITGEWERRLIRAVTLVSRVKVITHLRGKLPAVEAKAPALVREDGAAGAPRLLAIGASTGGPGAVLLLLKSLGLDFPVPILLVLHIGESFAEALASWLASQTGMPVRCAVDGDSLPEPGRASVLMAPAERHLELRGDTLRLTTGAARNSCRPSIDVLFESVAAELGSQAIGCLLTGMGRDGAEGLLSMRQAGAWTIAQDEATSVVYGMPAEAARLGAAAAILPLPDIAPELRRLVSTGEGRRRP